MLKCGVIVDVNTHLLNYFYIWLCYC